MKTHNSVLVNVKEYKEQEIRVQWNKEEMQWYFCITDILGILQKKDNGVNTWRKIRRQHPELLEVSYGIRMYDSNSNRRIVECATKYGILRIINILPENINNELFKVWLADN